eukprot:5243599-Alexandrium_andersonii.AAC.1
MPPTFRIKLQAARGAEQHYRAAQRQRGPPSKPSLRQRWSGQLQLFTAPRHVRPPVPLALRRRGMRTRGEACSEEQGMACREA